MSVLMQLDHGSNSVFGGKGVARYLARTGYFSGVFAHSLQATLYPLKGCACNG